jgi:hypothetical protein
MVPRSSGSTHGVYWYQDSTSTSASIHLSSGPTVNTWHTFTLDALTGDWSFDATTGTVTALSGSLTTGKNYGIFARIGPDGSIQQKGARFSYFKIWKGGVLVRDYIPVRVGSVGYLYDQVSQQLFGNNGTGSFAYGNDVTP